MGQVGKRPSSPVFLFVVALVWIACGIAAFFLFSASWRIVVGVVFIGIGLFWLRGAMATIARHEDRLGEQTTRRVEPAYRPDQARVLTVAQPARAEPRRIGTRTAKRP